MTTSGSFSAQEINNTRAEAFDVRLRYFLNDTIFEERTDLADFTYDGTPTDWTITGDTITPSASEWRDVTQYVTYNGGFHHKLNNSTIDWEADVKGYNYFNSGSNIFSVGKTLLCMRNIVRNTLVNGSGYESGWKLWWIGSIEDGGFSENYKHGEEWNRSVKSANCTLNTVDAPRMMLNSINKIDGATVKDVSSTLATPAIEAANREFIGSTANVDSGNIVDGRLNTVWIAQDQPIATTETTVQGAGASYVVIDEIFNNPLSGYDSSRAWWIELFNTANSEQVIASKDQNRYCLLTLNSDGDPVGLFFGSPFGVNPVEPDEIKLGPYERMIICGDINIFNAITGGARNAKYIIEAKSFGTVIPTTDPNYPEATFPSTTYRKFDIKSDDNYILFGTPWDDLESEQEWDLVKIGTVTSPGGIDSSWTGAGIDVSSVVTGQSIRRYPSGTDTNTADDWIIEEYPRPGEKYNIVEPQWVQIELPKHTSTLSASISSSVTQLGIDEGTTGWPPSGRGVIESDEFEYTGRSTTALTGVSGLSESHALGATDFWPMSAGVAQTGWKVRNVYVKRIPNLDKIKRWRLYTSQDDDCDNPSNNDLFAADYSTLIRSGTNGTTEDNALDTIAITSRIISRPDSGTTVVTNWTRTLLFIIDEMWSGRAKINEIEATLDSLTLNESNLADIDNATAVDVIKYIIKNHTWYASDSYVTDFTVVNGDSIGWGEVGSLATAIKDVPSVLDDVCRVSGCIIEWTRDGKISIYTDRWWPGGNIEPFGEKVIKGIISDSDIRGDIQYSDSRSSITGVALNAKDPLGNDIGRILVPPGVTDGSGIQEISDVVTKDAFTAQLLAYLMYAKLHSTAEITLNIKGIGEWCEPRQLIGVTFNGEDYGIYMIEGVDYRWDQNDNAKSWNTTLKLRRYGSI